ncbi:MAG: hypothetical protein H7X88_07850 [Gloeobacteraceae cyanobacterium ES-bin-316]|nr:hypothetical protein [Ferruginibacter sp.]
MTPSARFLRPLLLLFAVLTIFILSLKTFLVKYGVDVNVLFAANFIFLLINVLVFLYQKKALTNPNPNVFIRSVIAGMMIKMFVCAIAVLAYVVLVGKDYNKKAVFISMFIYLIYLAAEVATLMKLNNQKNA